MKERNDYNINRSGMFTSGNFAIFTDASLSPGAKCGVGVFLIVPTSLLELPPEDINKSEIVRNMQVKMFDSTSSTKLEVQTLLWGIQYSRETSNISFRNKLSVYCDSQCIAGLPGRRSHLEKESFFSKGSKKLLNHADLYRKFYKLQDELGFNVIKVTGHSRSSSHNTVHRLFSFVDRRARKELKHLMAEKYKNSQM